MTVSLATSGLFRALSDMERQDRRLHAGPAQPGLLRLSVAVLCNIAHERGYRPLGVVAALDSMTRLSLPRPFPIQALLDTLPATFWARHAESVLFDDLLEEMAGAGFTHIEFIP